MFHPLGRSAGSLLGAARAEADTGMLQKAFVETPDYRALTQSHDYNFVVGRRGSGKSALFQKVRDFFSRTPRTIVITGVAQEHQSLELQRLLAKYGDDYRSQRAVARLIWKSHLLFEVLKCLRGNYKISRAPDYGFLMSYMQQFKGILQVDCADRLLAIFRLVAGGTLADVGMPTRIASAMQTDRLLQAIKGVSRIN